MRRLTLRNSDSDEVTDVYVQADGKVTVTGENENLLVDYLTTAQTTRVSAGKLSQHVNQVPALSAYFIDYAYALPFILYKHTQKRYEVLNAIA